MSVVRLGLRYFAWVFAAGFLLGVLRTVWLAPLLGVERAEIVELPLMVGICWWVARELFGGGGNVPMPDRRERFAAGAFALLCLLAVELSVVLALRGETLGAWAASRKSLAGALWVLSMLLFALLPGLVAVREAGAPPR